MGNPEEAETTINVKRVRVTSWEAARKLAAKHGEHMGATLSRAIDQLAKIDTLPREILPTVHAENQTGNPVNLGPDLVALLNATAAIAAATNGKIGVVPGLRTLLETLVSETQRGLLALQPPPPTEINGKIGQSFNQSGQSARKTALLENGQDNPHADAAE